MKFAPLAVVTLLSLGASAEAQVQQMQPDSPKFMNGEFIDASSKVFAVDSHDKGPIGVVGVEEVKQQQPPSLWAVSVQNRGSAAVTYRMSAVVVTGDNRIKGSQQLPTIRDLKPGKVSRQQIKIFPTILNPTDRVVFYLSEATVDGVAWKVDKDAANELVTSVAARHPVK